MRGSCRGRRGEESAARLCFSGKGERVARRKAASGVAGRWSARAGEERARCREGKGRRGNSSTRVVGEKRREELGTRVGRVCAELKRTSCFGAFEIEPGGSRTPPKAARPREKSKLFTPRFWAEGLEGEGRRKGWCAPRKEK